MVRRHGSFCTIVETNEFAGLKDRIFAADELDALFDYLSTRPDAGVVVPGSGGIRKLRWGQGANGKRGGARVIYFHRREQMRVVLLTAYAKNRKSDLDKDELMRMRKNVEELD